MTDLAKLAEAVGLASYAYVAGLSGGVVLGWVWGGIPYMRKRALIALLCLHMLWPIVWTRAAILRAMDGRDG